MRQATIEGVLFTYYDTNETRQEFVPLRDRIFDIGKEGVSRVSKSIFCDAVWPRIIIRGALMHSNRAPRPDPLFEGRLLAHEDDPRDELQPLFDVLTEDGVKEIIHMAPYVSPLMNPLGEVRFDVDAVGLPPTAEGSRVVDRKTHAIVLQERLLFDRSARWGFFGSDEMFGLLGGEPDFISRYVQKAGGWEFIRRAADAYWQSVVDDDGFEAPMVAHYYELAGWDDVPVKRR